ncbi:MAG TPA: ATP synthase F0 subunit B [Myxococcota bacterium]|jgi:F-type H+-transporting ATPase subunit b|nr:ATP synthase F0 subunit B [Myxococcota bacterium]
MMPDRLRQLPAACGAAAAMLAAAPASASEGLNLAPTPNVFLTLIVLFAILVPVLNVLLFKPVLRVLDEREQRIDGARRRAEEMTRKAEATLLKYEGAIQDARAAAEAERKQTLERAQREHAGAVAEERTQAEQTLERARREVMGALAGARGQLQAQSRELARDVASRVLGRAL